MCKDSGVSMWHYEKLIWSTGTLDIGLIKSDPNVEAPLIEPRVKVPPLGKTIADKVMHA